MLVDVTADDVQEKMPLKQQAGVVTPHNFLHALVWLLESLVSSLKSYSTDVVSAAA